MTRASPQPVCGKQGQQGFVGRWVRCLPNAWVELGLPLSTAPNPVPRLQELDTKHYCCHLGSLRLTEPQQLRASLGRLGKSC